MTVTIEQLDSEVKLNSAKLQVVQFKNQVDNAITSLRMALQRLQDSDPSVYYTDYNVGTAIVRKEVAQ